MKDFIEKGNEALVEIKKYYKANNIKLEDLHDHHDFSEAIEDYPTASNS